MNHIWNVLLACLLWTTLSTHSFAQKDRGTIITPTDSDIIIDDVRYIDTLYHIFNPKRSFLYVKHIFTNRAECYFYSDSLFFPKKFGKRQFVKNVYNPHAFYPVLESFVFKVILPRIPDDYIYKRWIDSSYNDNWHSSLKLVSRVHTKKQEYATIVPNTNYFLAVKIKASTFNREYNQIYNPPMFFFNKSKNDPYITFLVALINKEEYDTLVPE